MIELANMFTEQKWNILKSLSMKSYSPLQLAKLSNTSIANISQQLRLLEAASLVKKEKISNRDKGKPRTLFSLSDDYAYLVSTMNNFANKRLLKLTEHHETILRIWFLDHVSSHYHLEKFYWFIEPNLDMLNSFAVASVGNNLELVLLAEDVKNVREIVNSFSRKVDDFGLGITVLRPSDAFKRINTSREPFSELRNTHVIYDSKGDLSIALKNALGDIHA